MHLAERIKVFLAMRRVKIEAKHLLLKFKSHPHGVLGVWHLLKSHFENRHKKPQKPYGIWDFCCGIYLGCTIWLREWDLKTKERVICYSAVDTPNDAGFRQFVGGIDPDSTRASPLRSDSDSEANEVHPHLCTIFAKAKKEDSFFNESL